MASDWIETRSRYSDVPGVDPYIDLALGTPEGGFYAYERRQPWASVLLRLNGISASKFAGGEFYHDPKWREWWKSLVHVPALYRHPAAGLGAQRSCTAYVRGHEFFDELLARFRPLQQAVAQITFGRFFDSGYAPPEEAGGPSHAEQTEPSGDPEHGTVVIGIIDDGLAFGHERFRSSPYETRVEYLWLQDGAYDRKGSPVPYGRELRKCDIDGLLQRYLPAGFVDEDDLYRRAGVVDFGRDGRKPLARRLAHGTHVVDLACGYDFRTEPRRRDRPIVCVQLPTAASEDTSGATLDDYGLDAIRYILERAEEIARTRKCRRLPVVINFSYGIVAGPHDGTSDLEVAIDDLIEARPNTRVVLPAGNSRLERLHAEVAFERPGQIVNLHWRVLPDDETPTFMEIWLPPGPPPAQSRSRLRVAPPGLAASPALEENSGSGLQWQRSAGVVCEVRYRHMPDPRGGTGRGMFLVALQPSARLESRRPGGPPRPTAPSGLWKVILENGEATHLTPEYPVEAWIQRDDTPSGFRRRGRQSRFEERSYVRFNPQGRVVEEDNDPAQKASPSDVKRAGSINAIATGRNTVVVGGLLRKEYRTASYSAEPAQRTPNNLRYGVSDDSLVHGGVLAAGTRSGSVIAMNGTSVAAPEATREIADQLADGPPKAPRHPPIPRP